MAFRAQQRSWLATCGKISHKKQPMYLSQTIRGMWLVQDHQAPRLLHQSIMIVLIQEIMLFKTKNSLSCKWWSRTMPIINRCLLDTDNTLSHSMLRNQTSHRRRNTQTHSEKKQSNSSLTKRLTKIKMPWPSTKRKLWMNLSSCHRTSSIQTRRQRKWRRCAQCYRTDRLLHTLNNSGLQRTQLLIYQSSNE